MTAEMYGERFGQMAIDVAMVALPVLKPAAMAGAMASITKPFGAVGRVAGAAARLSTTPALFSAVSLTGKTDRQSGDEICAGLPQVDLRESWRWKHVSQGVDQVAERMLLEGLEDPGSR